MSIVTSRSLFCDRCPNWFDSGDPLDLAPRIRRQSKKYGWVRRGGEDFCPDCAEPGSGQVREGGTDDGR